MAQQRHDKPDASQLWPVIEDIALSLYELPAPDRPEAKALYDGLAAIISEELQTYSKQLADGDMARAKSTLETLGQKLTALASSVADNSGRLFNDTAETLSVEIEKGLGLYRQLEDIYTQFGKLRQEVKRATNQWSLSDDDPVIKEHLVWLLDDTEGFNTRVSNYLIDPSSKQEVAMGELRDEAKQRLNTLQAIIDQAETARQRMKEKALPILTLLTSAIRLLNQLQRVRDAIQLLPEETVAEVVSDSELLTTEEREGWRYYEEHAYFGNPDRVKTHLTDQAEKIRRRLDDAPKLSEAAMAAIADAQRYVERLHNRLEVMASPATVAPPKKPSVRQRPQMATLTSEPKPVLATPKDKRLEEVYQLAVVVASYKYCSPQHVVGMTVASVLGILVALGKITEHERVSHRDALEERLLSRSLKVTNNRKVHGLWEKTSPLDYDWIYFKPRVDGRLWLWRLVRKAQAPGQEIARQLGITQAAVEKAFEDHREAQQARYLQRKKEKEN
jgi:hypothetical protein